MTVVADSAVMLNNLCTLFGLSHFDRQLLLLCAIMEIDSDISQLCADISEQPYPSMALALAVFNGHYAALAPTAPLRYHQLIEQKNDHQSLVRQSLTISPWALYYLTAMPSMDSALLILLQQVEVWQPVLSSHRAEAQQLQQTLGTHHDETSVTQLITASDDGQQQGDQQQIVALAANDDERPIYAINLFQLPLNNDELDHLRRHRHR